MDSRTRTSIDDPERARHLDSFFRVVRLDAPDYATAIDRLTELSVIPSERATRLRPMAGFRNVLVYAYLDVDLGMLQRILSEHITDLESFADSVEAYIEQA